MNKQFKIIMQLFSLIILLTIFVLLFYPMLSKLVIFYTMPGQEQDYIYIIPLFSVYFLWIQRERLKVLNINKSDTCSLRTGFIMILFGLFLYALGKYTYILSIQGVAFIVTIAGSVLFLYGRETFKVTAVPIFFLLYMLPIPPPVRYAISGHLKYLVADMSAKALLFFHIPVIIEGTYLHLPKISFLVHDICSGIRTIISLLAIATGFAYLTLTSWRYKAIFIALSIPLGIIVNVLRVFMIGALSYLYNKNVAMTYHDYSFGFVTPVGIVSIFLIGNIFRCLERKGTS